MAIKHIDLEERYIPKTNTEDIIIEVIIGDGGDAVGSYAVFVGKEFIDANATANIGKKANLENKRTTISCAIPDVLKETNWTSITVIIREGLEETKFGPYKAEVEAHLDTAIYTLKITHQ